MLLQPLACRADNEIVDQLVEPSDYAIAREALLDAIIGSGLIPGQISHFGDMLARTGDALGHPRAAYAEAEIFSFCSASVSWTLVAEHLHNIALCPLTVALYTLPGEPQRIHFAYRDPGAASAGTRRAQNLLREIVGAAITQSRRFDPADATRTPPQ